VDVLQMSWTITSIAQSCSRPFLDMLWMSWTITATMLSLLQTICGCAVDVLDHYSNYTILPQTIPG
jgi:hypothetical protein